MSEQITMQDLIEANKDRHERAHVDESAKIARVWEAIEALRGEGFEVEHEPWNATYITLDISVADLQRAYRAVGPVKLWFKDVAYDHKIGKHLTDHVQVTLTATRYPEVHFRYNKPLVEPVAGSSRKCRIVTTSRVETSTQLVCDRD